MRTTVYLNSANTGEPDVYEDAEGAVYEGECTVSDMEQGVLRTYAPGEWLMLQVVA